MIKYNEISMKFKSKIKTFYKIENNQIERSLS